MGLLKLLVLIFISSCFGLSEPPNPAKIATQEIPNILTNPLTLSNDKPQPIPTVLETLESYKPQQKINPVTKTANLCFCFEKPTSPILVPDLMKAQEHKLERLVVYLYRDLTTNRIVMYTPNAEKQRLIPDLAKDPNDVLRKISGETIVGIFHESRNIVSLDKVLRDSSAKLESTEEDGHVKHVPFGTHLGQIDEIVPNTHSENKSNRLKYRFDIFDSNLINPYKQLPLKPVKVLPGNPHDNPGPLNLPYEVQYQNAIPWNSINSPITSLPHEINDIDYDVYGQEMGEFRNDLDHWLELQINYLQESQAMLLSPSKIEVVKKHIRDTLRNNGLVVNRQGVVIDSNGYALDLALLKLRPLIIGDPISHNQLNLDYDVKPPTSFFEYLLITLVYPPKLLGIISLGKVYLPRESSVYQRLITNPRQAIPGINGLSLTDESVPIKHRLLMVDDISNHEQTRRVDKTSPDLKAKPSNKKPSILENLLKYLKLFRRNSAAGQNVDLDTAIGASNPDDVSNDLRYKPYINKIIKQDENNENTVKEPAKVRDESLDRTLEDAKIDSDFSFRSLDGKNDQKESEPSDSLPTIQENLNSAIDQSGEKASMEGLMETLEMLLINPKLTFFDDEEEEPDFRIIGGKAATSSGSPISNRGRSGFISENI